MCADVWLGEMASRQCTVKLHHIRLHNILRRYHGDDASRTLARDARPVLDRWAIRIADLLLVSIVNRLQSAFVVSCLSDTVVLV